MSKYTQSKFLKIISVCALLSTTAMSAAHAEGGLGDAVGGAVGGVGGAVGGAVGGVGAAAGVGAGSSDAGTGVGAGVGVGVGGTGVGVGAGVGVSGSGVGAGVGAGVGTNSASDSTGSGTNSGSGSTSNSGSTANATTSTGTSGGALSTRSAMPDLAGVVLMSSDRQVLGIVQSARPDSQGVRVDVQLNNQLGIGKATTQLILPSPNPRSGQIRLRKSMSNLVRLIN